MGEKKGRRSRLDKGVIRTKLRDIDLLRFIGEQQAVSRQVLIWLCTTKSDAAQSWLNRMDALGCVGMEDVTTAKKAQRYIWATRAGLKKGELPYKTRRSKQFQHANAVAMARIWLQGFDDALAHPEDWESERAQRHIIAREGNDHAGVHVPDGIYRKNIAVECELSAKGVDATVAIMEQLLNEYRYVVYIVSHEAAKKVQQAVEKVASTAALEASRIRVYHLSDILRILEHRHTARITIRRQAHRQPPFPSIQLPPPYQPLTPVQCERILATLVATQDSLTPEKLIELIYDTAEQYQQPVWQVMSILIGLYLNEPAFRKELFDQLLGLVPLTEGERILLSTMDSCIIFNQLVNMSLTTAEGKLPGIPLEYSANQISAVGSLLHVLGWDDDRRRSCRVWGAALETHKAWESASQSYYELVIREPSAMLPVDLLIALGRVAAQRECLQESLAFYKQARDRLQATGTHTSLLAAVLDCVTDVTRKLNSTAYKKTDSKER